MLTEKGEEQHNAEPNSTDSTTCKKSVNLVDNQRTVIVALLVPVIGIIASLIAIPSIFFIFMGNDSNDNSTQAQSQIPTAKSDLGITIAELQSRFQSACEKCDSTLKLENLWTDSKGNLAFGFMATRYMGIGGQTVKGSNSIRYLICNSHAVSSEEVATTLIAFANIIHAVDPKQTQDSRNQILRDLKLLTLQTINKSANGDCIVNGLRYRSSHSTKNGIMLQISAPSDTQYMPIAPEDRQENSEKAQKVNEI